MKLNTTTAHGMFGTREQSFGPTNSSCAVVSIKNNIIPDDLVVLGIRPVANGTNAVAINHFNDKVGLCQQESRGQFVDALIDNVNGGGLIALFRGGWVGLVHDREAKVGGVSLAAVGHFGQSGQVVHPVE